MKNKKLIADIALIAVLLLVTLGSYLAFNMTTEKGKMAVVKVNNVEIGRYSLDVDGEYSLNGGTNILVIENHSAYLIDADCPDKLCVKQGKIKSTGQCITCLPNKLTVTIVGDGDSGVDFLG